MRSLLCFVACLCLLGCSSSSDHEQMPRLDVGISDGATFQDAETHDEDMLSPREHIEALPTLSDTLIPGLNDEVFVLRTEGNIPHVYASNRQDLMRVYGYLVASDRFWMMDLARRLGSGRLSALFGATVLSTDITTRAKGLHLVADRIWTSLSAERQLEVSAFAAGVNAYIDAVTAGDLPPPSEFTAAFPLLGAAAAVELMEPFTGQDIAAYAAVIAEESACSRNEIRRTLSVDDLLSRIDPPANAQSWSVILDDLFHRIKPLILVKTDAPAIRMSMFSTPSEPVFPTVSSGSGIAPIVLEQLSRRMLGARRFHGNIVGSNAWAAAGAHTDTGGPIVAGDGHLELTAPAYFHQAGLDLSVLGEEDWHVRGNFMAGIPALGVGTNGKVAWSFTCFYSDTIDYFREVLVLDDAGQLVATEYQGESKPVVATMETYTIRAAPVLDSMGGNVQAPSFELFDGRRLLSAEGRPAGPDEDGIDFGDGPIVLEDVDGDGEITGISYDATFLDAGDLLGGYFDLSEAQDLTGFKDAQKKLMVTGSHFVAIEQAGGVLATGYHASPCRDVLARSEDDTRFEAGADPQLVLDGTQYGGFKVTLDESGHPMPGEAGTANCTVPYERFPNVEDPAQGFVVSGNNDPSGLSFDGSIANDGVYIGGPWDIGFRGHRIDDRLGALVSEDAVTVDAMASIQADVVSSGGARWTPHIIDAVTHARAISVMGGEQAHESDDRLVLLYQMNQERIDEATQRLQEWVSSGAQARSGVETVYNRPSDQDRTDAVATTIFNFWLSAFKTRLLDDLELISAHRLTDDNTIGRFIDGLLSGRGAGNPNGLATFDDELEESTLFNQADTSTIERSHEVIVLALLDGLDAAAQAPITRGVGGFGTDDMNQWLWGLRHMVRIDSIIAPFLTDSAALLAFANLFSITPKNLPLVEGSLPGDDPRSALPGFPRPGDNYAVDSAEHGFSMSDFAYRAGPVMRMVIGLTSNGRVTGQNIMPGGQSGLKDSPHFADQLAEWLGNRAFPLRFHLDEVLEYADGKERFSSEVNP